jgi:hypothetical protein
VALLRLSRRDLIALPQIRLFELNNNGIAGGLDAHPQGWKPEQFWDVVNAHRAAHDQPLLLGVGTDDRHSYESPPKPGASFGRRICVRRSCWKRCPPVISTPPTGWISRRFNSTARRCRSRSTSANKAVPDSVPRHEEGLRSVQPGCRGGKRPRNPARKIDIYSDTIGVVLKAVEEPEGSYTLKSDDLYVRAKIVKVAEDLSPTGSPSPPRGPSRTDWPQWLGPKRTAGALS